MPSSIAVLKPDRLNPNRRVKNDLDIPEEWQTCLDEMFGNHGWYEVFCPPRSGGLFESDPEDRAKSADMKKIGRYFNDRLKTIFAGVADNPLTLYNSKGAALFLLCFATANPYAVRPALKIAQHILKQERTKKPTPESRKPQ